MNKKEFMKKLEAAQQSRDALQNGIATLEPKLAELKAKAQKELAATGETDLSGEISSTESYLELRRSALIQANEAVKAAQFELDDYIAAERYTEAANLHKEYRALLNQLEKQLGDAGVNKLVNEAFDIMDQIHTMIGRDAQDEIGMDLRHTFSILVNVNQHLFKAWQDLRSMPWVGEPTGGIDTAYYKTGFGRTYS